MGDSEWRSEGPFTAKTSLNDKEKEDVCTRIQSGSLSPRLLELPSLDGITSVRSLEIIKS